MNKRRPSCFAVIPARKGSKGIPNKNTKTCAGKPLIAWTIEAAIKSESIQRVIVSTDCPNIAQTAVKFGADVPFLRRKELAQDDSSVIDVLSDILIEIPSLEVEYDLLVLLQPTSPLRTHEHIDAAVAEYMQHRKSSQDTLFSASPLDSKVCWAVEVSEDGGYARPIFENKLTCSGRQALPRCFLPNGAIYIAPTHDFAGFYSNLSLIYKMDEDASIDIDYPDDLKIAEKLLLELPQTDKRGRD